MRRSIITIALTLLAFVMGGVVLGTVTAQPAEAAIGTTIFNDTHINLWVTVDHHYELMRPGHNTQLYGNGAKSFSVPDNICGYYTVNGHRVDNLIGGTVRVPRNSFVHVRQLRCPNGLWTENF